jgi:hypothetical protein
MVFEEMKEKVCELFFSANEQIECRQHFRRFIATKTAKAIGYSLLNVGIEKNLIFLTTIV